MNLLEFTRRRDRLMAAIGPQNVAIVRSAIEHRRNGDTDFPFRQESDFIYLTGFNEPNALLVLTPCREDGETTIFVNPNDPKSEQWTGRRLGVDAAAERLGVDHAYDVSHVDSRLPELLEGRQAIHATWGLDVSHDEQIFSWLRTLRSQRKLAPNEYVQLSNSLHELRVIKTPAEQETMQRAADISAKAHTQAMKVCKPGLHEWNLEAALLHEFMNNGARFAAYPSIVGSGDNGCIMHYVDNASELKEGDLVLIDAGCELDHYASDLTRTFPVTGTFSARQRELYSLVLEAQKLAIGAAKPGARFTDPHESSRRCLTQGLIDLGMISESLESALEQRSDAPFLVHRCSHWLGLDVHDVGEYQRNGQSRVLEPGMVMTIEPGLYISPHLKESSSHIADEWFGLGIRIEDDVLVTEDGQRVLTRDAPKEIADIEQLMNG